jgi:mono/diheme cytochrome c family protein
VIRIHTIQDQTPAGSNHSRRSRALIIPIVVLTSAGAYAQQHPAAAAPTGGEPAQRALLDKYCVTCHNQKLNTAGVVLDRADVTRPGESPAIWERVLRKVRMGQMPPPGMPRLPAPESAALVKYLETSLDQAALAHPNPGRTSAHRLNRAEYSNAIRDLLALDIDAGSLLPVDDSGYGFDNIADVLTISPALFERYMSAARQVSSLAVGDPSVKPIEEALFTAPKAKAGKGVTERVSDDLPFDSRGGMSVKHYFPLDGEYVIRINLAGASTGAKSPYELRVPLKAGLRSVGVDFLRESALPESAAPAGGRRGGGIGGRGGRGDAEAPLAQMDLRIDGAKVKRFEVPETAATPEVDTVMLGGPYNITGRGDTASRAKIFVCRPTNAAAEKACAHTILAALAHRAFRRPVIDADVTPLLALYENGRAEGDFDLGIQKALRAMLISPDFLFRTESDPRGAAPGTVYRISDLELASRLSFFLWSSIPDDELLKASEQNKLHDPAVLQAQVRRMLADERSDALVQNFGGQWLYLRNLSSVKPDPDIFADFDDNLRKAFRRETDLFLSSIFREDHSVLDVLGANYTFLNDRLAAHYGVPNIYGSQFRKVVTTDPNRQGLLGQGSLLTVTSYPNRTSVVQRGKWILENLLGAPPPPPPPDVPPLEATTTGSKLLTMREAMEKHRANAICAGCHGRMDPIGFAMENYDGVGKWRDSDGGSKIDASGKLPGGVEFQGPAGLRKLMLTSYKDEFVSTVTEKLLLYALGRGLESYDRPAVRSIARQASRDNYKISALVTGIVESTPFQMRRMPEK